jgi:hypothetical protein
MTTTITKTYAAISPLADVTRHLNEIVIFDACTVVDGALAYGEQHEATVTDDEIEIELAVGLYRVDHSRLQVHAVPAGWDRLRWVLVGAADAVLTDLVNVKDPALLVGAQTILLPVVAPAITGDHEDEGVLTCSDGTYIQTPAKVEKVWAADGTPLVGETGDTLTLDETTALQDITCTVTAYAGAVSVASSDAPAL